MSKHDRSVSSENVLQHPSTKRAKQIDAHTPYSELLEVLEESSSTGKDDKKKKNKGKNVLHWFRSKDLRLHDNRALHAASQKAKETGGKLICVYLHSPKDLAWHGTSPARVDFILQSLRLLKEELEKERNVPVAVLEARERGEKVGKLVEWAEKWEVGWVFANFEYEVDELRRDIEVAKRWAEEGVFFEVTHDQTVIEPGVLKGGGGGPMKVFTPFHKAWLGEVREDEGLLDGVGEPDGNEEGARKELEELFGGEVPQGEDFEGRDRLRELWPAGYDAGMERLRNFLEKKVTSYATHRSEPAGDPSSRLSPYFASGIISVREVLQHAKKANGDSHFDSGDKGIQSWVREVVFREFYRHMMVITPHNAMNLPQNLKFDFVHWEDDEEGWKKWCEGKTGMPFIDAGMRQLNHEGYMHNRLRMNTSSYLRANLLIDYRRGERYFAEHLIDWDLSNNTQGWEPSYTIFNPVIQGEKCDKEGEYIRKWVPELKDLKGKDIFDPYNRLDKKQFEKLGYPAPHVDFHESQQRAKQRYKQDLADADP